jgi:hypothetical protein
MAGLLSTVPAGRKYLMRFSRMQILGGFLLLALIWLIVILRLAF